MLPAAKYTQDLAVEQRSACWLECDFYFNNFTEDQLRCTQCVYSKSKQYRFKQVIFSKLWIVCVLVYSYSLFICSVNNSFSLNISSDELWTVMNCYSTEVYTNTSTIIVLATICCSNSCVFLCAVCLMCVCVCGTSHLAQNPFICDCHLKWLADYLQDNPIETSGARCTSPRRLANKRIGQIKSKKFRCSGINTRMQAVLVWD